MRATVSIVAFYVVLVGGLMAVAAEKDRKPAVEVEEVVTVFAPANNRSSPTWAYGAPLVVRMGDDVFVSTLETGENIQPFCNTRWQLWHRSESGWQVVQDGKKFNEREPCPLAVLPGGRLFLSVNPNKKEGGYGLSDPHMLQFDMAALAEPPKPLYPAWTEHVHFNQHSYRGLAVDRDANELFMLNIYGNHYYGSLKDACEKWYPVPAIAFPVRVGYPQVVLHNRAAYILAISNVDEPNQEWREQRQGGQGEVEWMPVFRRLFYTWTSDVLTLPFVPPMEVDTVEATGGRIYNCDLLGDGEGRARLLYIRHDYSDVSIREKFFPDKKETSQLIEMVIESGKIVRRTVLLDDTQPVAEGELAGKTLATNWARYHVAEDGRLYVLCSAAIGKSGDSYVLLSLDEKGSVSSLQPLKSEYPMIRFFTNTVRGGSDPSNVIDVFGIAHGSDTFHLRYARIRLP